MLKFRCAKDNYTTDHTYPRATDPVSDKWLTISGVTTNTFDINVSKSTDLSQHVYISSVASGLKKANSSVRLVADSLSFTCTFDGGNATKTYPRATDPVSERFIPIKIVRLILLIYLLERLTLVTMHTPIMVVHHLTILRFKTEQLL